MSNTLFTQVTIPPDAKESFAKWQAKLQNEIANFPGFLSLEIHGQKSSWTIVQRFKDETAANSWKESSKELFDELRILSKQNLREEKQTLSGVTEVIITEVSPEKKDFYQQWLAKIHQAEAKLSGFRGMYVQAPDKGRFWITFLQFDTTENLDKWLASAERQEILKELDPLIKSVESHRIISPYSGWFGPIANVSLIKQTMLVLLVLFPIVMLEILFLSPWTKHLNTSLAMFIGNAISVSLISWPMMPLAIHFFRWWLISDKHLMGTLIILTLYTLEILLFL